MPEPPGTASTEALWEEGFGRALTEHLDDLYRFARWLVRDPEGAEDLVQETVLRAMEKRGQFRGESSLLAWLRRILHNLAIDQARRHAREVLVSEVEEKWRDDAYTVDASAVVERAQTREELEDALIRLPFAYRTVVVLHDEVGWTVQEIAEQIRVEVPAAKQRLRRGRMMLTTALAHGAERRRTLKGVPLSCWDARRKVSDYLDGELKEKERAALEGHLSACPTCPPLFAALVGVREALGAVRDPDRVIAPEIAKRIQSRIKGEIAWTNP